MFNILVTLGEIIVIVILLGVSFVITSYELALFSSNRIRLINLERRGVRGAKYARRLLKNYSITINTIILINIMANTAISVLLAEIFVRSYGEELGSVLAIVVGTIIIVLLGESVPKTLGLEHRESISTKLSPVMYFVAKIFSPLTKTLMSISNYIIKMIHGATRPYYRDSTYDTDRVSEDEVIIFLRLAEKSGSLARDERILMEKIMRFMDKKVREVMIPIKDLVMINSSDDINNIMDVLKKYRHSRYPVYEDSINNVIGYLHIKDLIIRENSGKEIDLKGLLRPIHRVYEDARLHEVLRLMRKTRSHIMLVVDYNSNVLGAVTLEDLLEEIFGEIYDEYD
mgnify:CR=1 FL=1